MATLKARRRRKLPAKSFGLPGSRKYPMDTKARAANAKGRATQMARRGKISATTKAKIHAKANRKLGKGRSRTRKRGR